MDRVINAKDKVIKKPKSKGLIVLTVLAIVVLFDQVFKVYLSINNQPRYQTAIEDSSWKSRSNGYAPHPSEYSGPVIQVYAARTWGMKKVLAVHTWIATKRQNESEYKISQVIGWRQRRSGTALFSQEGIPDKSWYGNKPELLVNLQGDGVELLIDKIDIAIANYPYSNDYTIWPGPNSNTFIAWLGKKVPELRLDLPSTAIGKDWRPIEHVAGLSPSGTGIQASMYGLLGFSLGFEEGLEINLLGLSFEADLFDLALEIPGYGRIGPAEITLQ